MQHQHPSAGWVVDHGEGVRYHPEGAGTLQLTGESRAYLVKDHEERGWSFHQYIRFDLTEGPLTFELDVKNVKPGCLACIYLVAMPDPTSSGKANYCDMANNRNPGLHGEICTELDILEINNNAAQTAIHTEMGNNWGSGPCDQNGCASMIGGPHSPHSTPQQKNLYGPRKMIDSNLPFDVTAEVDAFGEFKVSLKQNEKRVVVFDKHSGGNPPGKGVPTEALLATSASMGKLAVVASLWSDTDMSWFDGSTPRTCNLETASFKVSNIRTIVKPSPPSPMPPPPLPLMPSPSPPSPPPSPEPPLAPMPPTPPPPPVLPPRKPGFGPLPPSSPSPPPAVAFALADDGFFESLTPHEHPDPPPLPGLMQSPSIPPPQPPESSHGAILGGANIVVVAAGGACVAVACLATVVGLLFWRAAQPTTSRGPRQAKGEEADTTTIGTIFGRGRSSAPAKFSKLDSRAPPPASHRIAMSDEEDEDEMDGEEEEPDGHHHEDFDDRVRDEDYDLPPQAHTGRRAEYDTGCRAYYDAGRRASSAREQRSSAAPAPTTFGGRSAACATAMPMATAGADSDLD